MPSSSSRWWRGTRSHHKTFHKQLVYSLSDSRIPSLKQLKYLPKVVSPLQWRLIVILLSVAMINTAFLGWRSYVSATDEIPKVGGSYTEALVGNPQYINPILVQNNDTDRDLERFIYSGLVRYDESLAITPDLAERFEISADGKTYTFYLRHDVKWHDGEMFNAEDVVFTINKIKDPIVRSPLYVSFKDVEVKMADEYTVVFTLAKPFAPFIDLATIGILPEHVWQEETSESFGLTGKNLKPIGTGPWKYKSLQRESNGAFRTYTMERNDDYYAEKSYLTKLVFKFYPDTDSAIQALKNRTVQGISFLPKELRSKLEKDRDLKYYTYNVPQNTAVFFNQSRNADLRSKAVRQALALAIDRERIVQDVLAGEGRVINAPILPGFFGYYPEVKKYPFDTDRASSLLEAAGWKRDDQKQWYQDEKVTVTLAAEEGQEAKPQQVTQKRYLTVAITTTNQSDNANAAERIKEQWVAFGVGATVELVDPSRIKSDVIDTRDYEALLYGEIVGADPDLYPFWHSSQARAPGLNLALFTNKDADTYLEQGRNSTDPDTRLAAYKRFQDVLAEEVPAIFLYNPSYNYVVASKIKGITEDKELVYPSDRFVDIAAWYEKTSRRWKERE